jgi:hypothetical protein
MRFKIFFSFLLLIVVSARAQQNFGVLDANNITCNVSSTGDLFHRFSSDDLPGFEVPAGSGLRSIYAANLWIGGIDVSENLRLAAEMYESDGNDWFSGPLTNDGSAETSSDIMSQYNRVWVANAQDVQQHMLYFDLVANGESTETLFPGGYDIPQWILDWPAHGDVSQSQDYYLATFNDYNENGIYDPEAGDSPVFCGDRCVLFIMNDKGGVHTESGALPIGLQIIGMLYGFDSDEPALQNTVFVNYKILNQGTYTLTNCAAGMWCDFDLGNPNDDYVGTDVSRGCVYAMNGDAFDEDASVAMGFGEDLPVQGLVFLRGPRTDADLSDNPLTTNIAQAIENNGIPYASLGNGYGDEAFDNETLGMSNSIYFNSTSSPVNGVPNMAYHYYSYLQGRWKNGAALSHGGTGNDNGNLACRYMFPDDSDPLFWSTYGESVDPWNEVVAGNASGDRSMVIAASPFTIEPGEINELDFAFVFARESDGAQPLMETFGAYVDAVRNYFEEELSACSITPLALSTNENESFFTFEMFPNPTDGTCNIILPASMSTARVELTDAAGRLLYSENMRSSSQQFDFSREEAGLYFVRITSATETSVMPLLIH